jgi:F420H(2)-dependent quinone reductase
MRRQATIPRVDPTKRRPIRKLLIEPIAVTGAARWWLINVAPTIDRALFRLSGGRFTSLPANVLFLTHTGARSGKKRETPLVYFTDGDDVVVMASNYGREGHPAWYYNVRANPEVEVRAGGRSVRCRARVTEGEDRERLWGLAKQLTRAYANYESRASTREIQVIRLTPVDASG